VTGVNECRFNNTLISLLQSRGEGQHTSFFNWYYWSVNLGTLVALSVITYLQQQVSFFRGYLTSAICLGVSFIVFLMGELLYVQLK